MNRMRHGRAAGIGWVLAVVFLSATSAVAQTTRPVDSVVPTLRTADLVQAVDGARASGEEPLSAVIRALSAYPNAQTTGAEVRAALDELNIKVGDAGTATLAHLDRIVKTGNSIVISNSAESRVSAGSGEIAFAKTIKAKLRIDGPTLTLENLEGVKVTEPVSARLTRLQFGKNEAGDPVLRATGKWLFVTSTREINLREVKERAAANALESGASDRLNDVDR
ncbi:MAG: hypothetical protein HZA54_18545 [Planctomycetes bacterium]|nr:hypothetical protein [Planctomycetota bacterium]